MKRFSTVSITAVFLAAPAWADTACQAEITALFQAGLDPFNSPPFHRVLEVYGADGTLNYTMDSIAVTPIEQISGIRGGAQFMLMIDRQTYLGPSLEGPWTDSGMMMTEDMVAAQQSVAPSMAANVTEAECLGQVEGAAGPMLHYKYRTQVDPHPARGNSWWGAMNEVWISVETGLPMEMVLTEHVASWHEGVKDERHVISYTYDDTIEISKP